MTFCVKVTSCIIKRGERKLIVPPSLQKLCLCEAFSSSPNSSILRCGTKGLKRGHSSLLGLGNPSGSVAQDLSHCGVGSHSFSCPSWSTNHFSGKAVTVCSQINHMCPLDLCVCSAGLLPTKKTCNSEAHHICTKDMALIWLSQIYCSCTISWCAQIKNYFSSFSDEIQKRFIKDIYISFWMPDLTVRAVLDFTIALLSYFLWFKSHINALRSPKILKIIVS